MSKEDGIIRGRLKGQQASSYDRQRLIEKILARKETGGRKLKKGEARRKIIHLADMLSKEEKLL